jgi:hypothetical protein
MLDMVGGLNSYIQRQRELNVGECKISVYKFDDIYDVVFENRDISIVPLLTPSDFLPRGTTALLDAVGRTIDSLGVELSNTNEELRPDRVLFVIITDGIENASKTFSNEQIFEKIKHQKEVYSWDFVYIGANQDAWSVGTGMAIAGGSTLNYVASPEGVANMFDTLDISTTCYRTALDCHPDSFFKTNVNDNK